MIYLAWGIAALTTLSSFYFQSKYLEMKHHMEAEEQRRLWDQRMAEFRNRAGNGELRSIGDFNPWDDVC